MQTEEPSDKFPFQMLYYYGHQMPILPAEKFSRQQLEIIKGVILVCEFYAKDEPEKRLLKKACFWWNQLAEYWNRKNDGEKFEFIELKEIVVKETMALTVRPKQKLNEIDRRFLSSLRIGWKEDEEDYGEEDDSA